MSGIRIAGLEPGDVHLTSEQLGALGSQIGGALLRPGSEGWSDAVRVWNGMVDRVPALVAQPVSAAGVAAGVAFARAHGLSLSVKGGGHNIAGTAIAPGGLMMDMSRMRDITVDPARGVAHVGPGCLLGEVDRATQEHGLATVLGFVSRTGVAGLTLGGGLGYLTRRFGWAVDNLEEVEIVTADARIRTASRRDHPDLFWAVRGAGANFGAVTRFTFRLHPIGPMVSGGLIAWPFQRAEQVLRAYREMTRRGPRELSTWLILLHAPPAPFVPQQWHGQKLCAFAVCYTGGRDGMNKALAPLRSLGEPVLDLLREQPYVQLQSYLDSTEPAGMHHYWKTGYTAQLSEQMLSTLREVFAECEVPEGEIGVLHIGGALNERAEDDGAVGNRDARFAVGVKAMWDPDTSDPEAILRWVRAGWDRVRPFSTGRTYINFQTADEDEERVRAAYGANFDRLVELKRKYDPDNLFRSNRNVRPDAGPARDPGGARQQGPATGAATIPNTATTAGYRS